MFAWEEFLVYELVAVRAHHLLKGGKGGGAEQTHQKEHYNSVKHVYPDEQWILVAFLLISFPLFEPI